MKRWLASLLFFTAISTIAFSQTDSIPDYVPQRGVYSQPKPIRHDINPPKQIRNFKTIHKTNPFCLIIGNTPINSELRYMNETVFANKFSFTLSASYLFKGVYLSFIESIDTSTFQSNRPRLKLNGYRIQGSFRYYPLNATKAPKGFWFGPHFSFLDFKVSVRNSSNINYIKVTHWNANILCGYQFIIGRFCIDLYAGLGFKSNVWSVVDKSGKQTIDDIYDIYPPYASPLKLNFGSNFGVAF